MSYTFLGLVNDVCGRVNETPLTSSNFASAGAFYSTAKEAVNSSIRFINQEERRWPFSHTTYDQVLTAGTNRYSFQNDAKEVDFNTFRIQRDDILAVETIPLKQINYNRYITLGGIDAEYNNDTGIRQVPKYVSQGNSQDFVVFPSPDQAYTLTYEYYQLPTDLSLHSDIPSIPVAFRHVIVDGAMYYVYFFRGDIETADRIYQKFNEGIDNMRSIYINKNLDLVDTRLYQGNYTGAYLDI